MAGVLGALVGGAATKLMAARSATEGFNFGSVFVAIFGAIILIAFMRLLAAKVNDNN